MPTVAAAPEEPQSDKSQSDARKSDQPRSNEPKAEEMPGESSWSGINDAAEAAIAALRSLSDKAEKAGAAGAEQLRGLADKIDTERRDQVRDLSARATALISDVSRIVTSSAGEVSSRMEGTTEKLGATAAGTYAEWSRSGREFVERVKDKPESWQFASRVAETVQRGREAAEKVVETATRRRAKSEAEDK